MAQDVVTDTGTPRTERSGPLVIRQGCRRHPGDRVGGRRAGHGAARRRPDRRRVVADRHGRRQCGGRDARVAEELRDQDLRHRRQGRPPDRDRRGPRRDRRDRRHRVDPSSVARGRRPRGARPDRGGRGCEPPRERPGGRHPLARRSGRRDRRVPPSEARGRPSNARPRSLERGRVSAGTAWLRSSSVPVDRRRGRRDRHRRRSGRRMVDPSGGCERVQGECPPPGGPRRRRPRARRGRPRGPGHRAVPDAERPLLPRGHGALRTLGLRGHVDPERYGHGRATPHARRSSS